MEIICRIIKQHPLQQRSYTDRNGQQQTFVGVGLSLASGTDTLYAEITGDQARRVATDGITYSQDFYYKADLSAKAEKWTAKDGQERYGTRMYINKIAVL